MAAGAIPPLVHLLRSDTVPVQQQAAAALANLSAGSPSRKDAIVAAGAIPPLMHLLYSDDVQELATRALVNLSISD